MNQVVKDKMEREIMVVKTDKIFDTIERKNWFYKNDEENNIEQKIVLNYEFMKRWIAENNFDYKQPIPYAVVIDENDYIFVYKRWGENSNAWDKRLHNKISIWVWWHIEKEDIDSENPIYDTLTREIKEELNIDKDNIKEVHTIWYINDDSNDVWKVHIWIAYLIRIYNNNFDLLDGEIENGEFMKLENLDKLIKSWEYNVENWSEILIEPIKEIINSQE